MQKVDPQLIHLICGSTGAGKTTYARELADTVNGIHFSIDEWMVTLFGKDAPSELSPGWIFPRVERCENQIWSTVLRLGERGIPSVLDLGFQRRNHRRKYAGIIREAGFSAKLHFLDVDASERWRRVEQRNGSREETHHMTITRGMFDYIETIWEPPTIDELEAIVQH